MTEAALAQLVLAEQAEGELRSYHEFCFYNMMTERELAREAGTYYEMVRDDGELLFEFPDLESWRNTWVDPQFDGIPF